ncbi:hypothetical protein KPL71_024512 [Citrus sinensis]|uniref:Uncharacterized protein n=1 Tax=Citrus sinensis TaxID=2711 RepID=A0ACB8ISD8_CITSI|nr:hypothetical protein KPL71_024512 [Citrus sinensis]
MPTPEQARQLTSIVLQRLMAKIIHTTHSWEFLGVDSINQYNQVPVDLKSDVIVGVVDTGVWPESKGFNDDGLGPVAKKFKGACVPGDNFTLSNCNRYLAAYGFDEVVHDNVCYEENGNFVSLDNIIPSEENINWPFVSTTNPQHKDIDLDQLSKFDEYLNIVGREEVIVHPSFDLVEEREIVVDTISYCSLDLPKEDKKSCDIFQQLVDYEKKSFFLNYVEVRHEQYEKTFIREVVDRRIYFTPLE